MNKALSILIVFFAALLSHPQSASNLGNRYPTVTSYEVRPGILMTPRYTADSQVCQMSIERQRATRSGVMLDSFMSDKLVKEIADELAPRAERGNPSPGPEGRAIVLAIGVVTTTTYLYQNTNIEVLDGTGRERVVVISWKDRKCKEEPDSIPLQRYPH